MVNYSCKVAVSPVNFVSFAGFLKHPFHSLLCTQRFALFLLLLAGLLWLFLLHRLSCICSLLMMYH